MTMRGFTHAEHRLLHYLALGAIAFLVYSWDWRASTLGDLGIVTVVLIWYAAAIVLGRRWCDRCRHPVPRKNAWLTEWRCHICSRIRPDPSISVRSFHIQGLPGAIRNVRYCNDVQACIDGAAAWAETQKITRP